MEHAEVRELLGAYALGLLDHGEARAVEQHLPACAECRAALARSREVADLLPDALAEVSPVRVHPALAQPVLATAALAPAAHQPRRLRPPLWRATVAALFVLLVASTTWAIVLDRALTVARPGGSLDAAQQRRALDLVDSATTVRQALRPAEPGAPAYRQATGTLWTSPSGDDVLAVVNHLPPAPAGRHYELTVTADGRTTVAGRLELDGSGFAMLLFKADRRGPMYQSCMVTLDGVPVLVDAVSPAGAGSPTP
jgi:anti-sigma factor RsiW